MHIHLYEKEYPKPSKDYVRVEWTSLREFVSQCLQKLGVPKWDSDVVADVLVMADLMGIPSHGVQRLRRYVDGLRAGTINPIPNIRVEVEFGALAVIDGDRGLGQAVAIRGTEIAIEKASKFGISLVLIKNSNHFGIAGYYSLKIAENNMIGITISNSRPLVAYVNTIGRSIGSNPIAIAIPRKNPPPILFDAATSVVPIGKIELYAKIGKDVPCGWAIDALGRDLCGDAKKVLEEILRGGALLPLGGLFEITGGHKGSGLSLVIDIIAGVLSGASWGLHVGYSVGIKPANVGHAIAAIDISKITPLEVFLDRVERYINEIKNLPKHPKADRVWIPGEKAWLTMQTRKTIGIPIHREILKELQELGHELGVDAGIIKLM